jgi:hypothetical protein
LASRNPHYAEAVRKARVANCAAADRFAENVLPVVEAIERSGVTTLTGIAAALNARGIRTRTGRDWHPATVANLLRRRRPA